MRDRLVRAKFINVVLLWLKGDGRDADRLLKGNKQLGASDRLFASTLVTP